MIGRLCQFVKGILSVRVQGKNIARFLNLCIRVGIRFWDMEYLDGTRLRMRMYRKDIYRLRPFLRKTHVRIFVEERFGLPFLLQKYHGRKIYAAVLLGVIVGIELLSSRIWRIDVSGNSAIGEETILRYLDSKDIRYGVRKAAIDNGALELSLRQDFEEVIWASVYEEGTRLVISLQEKLVTTPGPGKTERCMDLVAGKDATVLSIITRSGTPMVVAGSEVKAGDILVCGRQSILDDNGELREYYYRSADADVIGTVVYDYEDWIESRIRIRQYTGNETKQYYLTFGNWQFKFPSLFADYDDYESLETIRQLVLMDSFYLPVYCGQIRRIERQNVGYTLTADEAREQALMRLEQFLGNLEENGVCISDKHVMIEKTGDRYHIYGTVTANESIIRQKPTKILAQPSGKKTLGEE